MLWFRKRTKPAEARRVAEIRFLYEQDGEPERALKREIFQDLLSTAGVQRAYLARVEYDDPAAYEVALCIRGPESVALVRQLSARFHELAPSGVHLDILFVNEEQEARLQSVCRAFFSRE